MTTLFGTIIVVVLGYLLGYVTGIDNAPVTLALLSAIVWGLLRVRRAIGVLREIDYLKEQYGLLLEDWGGLGKLAVNARRDERNQLVHEMDRIEYDIRNLRRRIW